jgi:hypothetical protein
MLAGGHNAVVGETRTACRYRGDRDANDIGLTVTESDPSFAHWSRLWSIYHNKQLLTTFKELAWHVGLKVRPSAEYQRQASLMDCQEEVAVSAPCPSVQGCCGVSDRAWTGCRLASIIEWRRSNRTASWMWCGRCTGFEA